MRVKIPSGPSRQALFVKQRVSSSPPAERRGRPQKWENDDRTPGISARAERTRVERDPHANLRADGNLLRRIARALLLPSPPRPSTPNRNGPEHGPPPLLRQT